ncbi:CRISPR-associated protein Cas4 [Dethiothermospora halolimnae]|uniref:CRISPR-associated protein Cas4 n=1 Tax=Dethiothermospora halolimnae TaxID=3114390 RepID=UPI003CCBD2AC
MRINGTLINYYFHCKRQCYLHGNRLNLEDNSENVKIGKAIHKEKETKGKNHEIAIENIKIDKLTEEYLTEIKKSDADVEACKWQLIFYLKVLKDKGINRKGKLEFIEKKKGNNKVLYFELNDELLRELNYYINKIENLIKSDEIPKSLNKPKCKKCAYYEYCYI